MDKFEISSDDCQILKAFNETKSLREAAQLLGCDPAGLTRRAQYLSSEYGLLQKVDNKWSLSDQGISLVAWTESSIQAQKKILLSKSTIRIGSTMWFSEEVLIPNLNKLKKIIGKETGISLLVPRLSFERALQEGSVDFVIACHPPEHPDIEHKKFENEEWILIIPPEWKLEKKNILEEIKKYPFIRHSEINTDLFLPGIGELKESDIKIDNLIGIRAAVKSGLGWSIVPRFCVLSELKAKLVREVPLDLKIKDRRVCLWWLRHRLEIKRQVSKIGPWLESWEEP